MRTPGHGKCQKATSPKSCAAATRHGSVAGIPRATTWTNLGRTAGILSPRESSLAMSLAWPGFLRTVFDAEGELRVGAPTEIRIGNSVVMISDGGGVREAMPAFLYVYVENADDTYRRAIAAGAESIERPADMPYGDRRATVRDPWANMWQIATYRGP